MTADVDIRGLSHRFGDVEALRDIDLHIDAGQFAVLLGPSGCGKTTLLSLVGGFLDPSEGRIVIGGQDVTQVPPAKRPTTTMFQDYALFPHMNLGANVGFGLRMRGVSRPLRRNKSLEMLRLVGLEEYYDKKPHQISGGQRQRVALARALAVEPDVLLLDEPLGALDLNLRRQMQDELKDIQRRVGTTFIHVTHDQEEAMAIADNIIVMNEGAIEDVGEPDRVYLNPRTLFAATFVGEANLLQCRIISSDGDNVVLDSIIGRIVVPPSKIPDQIRAPLADVTLCFRPEHVVVALTGDDVIELGEAVITDTAFIGAFKRCRVRMTNVSRQESQLPFNVHLAQASSLQTGDKVHIGVKADALVFL